jgi:hypothetical protein
MRLICGWMFVGLLASWIATPSSGWCGERDGREAERTLAPPAFPHANRWREETYATETNWISANIRVGTGVVQGPPEILRETAVTGLDIQVAADYHLGHRASITGELGYYSASAGPDAHSAGWGDLEMSQLLVGLFASWKFVASRYFEIRGGPRLMLVNENVSAARGRRSGTTRDFWVESTHAWSGTRLGVGGELQFLAFLTEFVETGVILQSGVTAGLSPDWDIGRNRPEDYSSIDPYWQKRFSVLLGCGYHF